MPYLLDTNVLSEFRKGRKCDPNVRKWSQLIQREQHYISVLSIGEIRKGIEILRRRSPQQCPAFEDWLCKLLNMHANSILPITERITERWGNLMAEHTLPVIDGFLAATALEYSLTIATRTVDDFAGTGVKIVNPFASA